MSASKTLSPVDQVQAWMKSNLTELSADQLKTMKPDEIAEIRAANIAACTKKLADMAWRWNTSELPKRVFTDDDWHVPYPVEKPRETVVRFTEPAAEPAELRVSNLAPETTENDLRPLFQRFGAVESVSIAKTAAGESRGNGVVKFTRRADAEMALENLHNYRLHFMVLRVEWPEPPLSIRAGVYVPPALRTRVEGITAEPDSPYDDRSDYTGTPYDERDANACRVCERDAQDSGWNGVCSRGCHRVEIGLDSP
jgi:hypothetical protein